MELLLAAAASPPLLYPPQLPCESVLRLPLIFWLLVIGGYLYYTHMTWESETLTPLREQVKNTKQQFTQLQKQNKEAEAFGKDRDANFQELQSLAEKFNTALEKLPKSSDTPGLLSNLAEISDRVGLEFARFEPGKAEMNGFLMETPFKIELRGTFVQVMSFLDEVAHLKRIVTGKSLSLKDPTLHGQSALLKAEATLVTYYFDESAKAAFDSKTAAAAAKNNPPPLATPATNQSSSSNTSGATTPKKKDEGK